MAKDRRLSPIMSLLTLAASNGLGVKCINAGGSTAFKYNARTFSLDDVVPFYGLTSRANRRSAAAGRAGPQNPASAAFALPTISAFRAMSRRRLATIEAARGSRLHLAHLQFYAYGNEGSHGFSSAAAELAAAVNAAPNVTVDVGQVMFRQTVTISADVLRQFNGAQMASPKKSMIMMAMGMAAGSCRISIARMISANAVQWACGLELFLLIDDPWRVYFTTDHPNGAPFTTYPEIFALIMSRDARAEALARQPQEAVAMTTLPSIAREYNYNEIAIMTRAAPARLLGLKDRGHLGEGGLADIAVYSPGKDLAKMFRFAHLVFKDGDLVVRDGRVTHYRWGKALKVNPGYDKAIDRRLAVYYDRHFGNSRDLFSVKENLLPHADGFQEVACAR